MDLDFITPEIGFQLFFWVITFLIVGIWGYRVWRSVWKVRDQNRRLYNWMKDVSRTVDAALAKLQDAASGNPRETEIERELQGEVRDLEPKDKNPTDLITSQIVDKIKEGEFQGVLEITREKPMELGGDWHLNPATFKIELQKKQKEKKSLIDELVPE